MAAKTERLLNLVVLLQRSSAWTTRAELRRIVPEYASSRSDEAFERMFERDKADLRDLGLRIDTGPPDAVGDEVGYRIPAEDHQLPAISLDASDLTILALASRAWQTAAVEQDARTAALKLSALAESGSPDAQPQFDIRLPESGEWLPTVLAAINQRRHVRFRYRSVSSGTTEARTLQPWHLLTRRGAWYLVGFDVAREAPRVFRTSRIVGEVVADPEAHAFERPPQSVVLDHVTALTSPEANKSATIRVASGRAHALRRAAIDVDASSGELTVPYASDDALASHLVALGGAATALAPESLVEAVRRHASALVAAHSPSEGSAP